MGRGQAHIAIMLTLAALGGGCAGPTPLVAEVAFQRGIDVPTAPMAPPAVGGRLIGAVGDRVLFGLTPNLLDPRRPTEAQFFDTDLRLFPTLAEGEGAAAGVWGIGHLAGLTLIDRSVAPPRLTEVALDSMPSVTARRDIAFVGGQWWLAGLELERFAADGTPLGAAPFSPSPWGCIAERPGGAWAVSFVTNHLEVVPLDPTGAPTAAPMVLVDVNEPRACRFRTVAEETWLCIETCGYGCSAGCSPMPDVLAGGWAPRFGTPLDVPGAQDAWGYVHDAGDGAIERWSPALGTTEAWRQHLDRVDGVVNLAGTLWAIGMRGRAHIAVEIAGRDLDIVSEVLLGGPSATTSAVRWAAPRPGAALLGVWESETQVIGTSGTFERSDARCGVVRAPHDGRAPEFLELSEACDGDVASVGDVDYLVAGGVVAPLDAALAIGAPVAETPALPFLASGPAVLFGAIECAPATGCLFSSATVDPSAVPATTFADGPHEVCAGSLGAVRAAGAEWGFVVGVRCANSIRALVLDTAGRMIEDTTLAAGSVDFAMLEDDSFDVVRSGPRVIVVVHSGRGPVHVFPFLDGVGEPEIVAPGPSVAWPSGDTLALPRSGSIVDLATGVVLENLDALVPLAGHGTDAGALDAGDGSTWLASSTRIARVHVAPPR